MKQRAVRRGVVALLVIALATSGCSLGGEDSTPGSEPARSDESAAEVDLRATLVGHGVSVIPTATALDALDSAAYGVALTESEVANMQRELGGRGGLLGSELDALVPMPATSPPFSFVLGAWLDLAETPRSRTARAWFPEETDWRLSPGVLFPVATLALFLADNAEAATKDLAEPRTSWRPAAHPVAEPLTGTVRPAAYRGRGPAALTAPCTAVSSFFSESLTALFGALRIDPKGIGTGAIRSVSGFLAGLWNHAVTLAEQVVRGLVKTLTQPVLEALARAMAIAHVVMHLSKYVFGWTIDLQASQRPLALPAAPDAGVEGFWWVVPDQRYNEFDDPIKDCVRELPGGHRLLNVFEPGSAVRWEVLPDTWNPIAPPQTPRFATYDAGTLLGAVPAGDGSTIRLPWRSTVEPAQEGQPDLGGMSVRVSLPRAELEQLYRASEAMLTAMIDQIAGQPAFVGLQLDGFLRQTLTGWLQPLLTTLRGKFDAAVASAFTVRGFGSTLVVYHPWQPPETPGAPPCFVGRWTMHRTPAGFGVEQSWQAWVFDITPGRFAMTVQRYTNAIQGVVGWRGDWSGGTSYTTRGPLAGDDFAVRTPGLRMVTRRSSAVWGFESTTPVVRADRAQDLAFGLQFNPRRFTCVGENRLRVTGVVDREYPFVYVLRRF